jgi:hypothetical protein
MAAGGRTSLLLGGSRLLRQCRGRHCLTSNRLARRKQSGRTRWCASRSDLLQAVSSPQSSRPPALQTARPRIRRSLHSRSLEEPPTASPPCSCARLIPSVAALISVTQPGDARFRDLPLMAQMACAAAIRRFRAECATLPMSGYPTASHMSMIRGDRAGITVRRLRRLTAAGQRMERKRCSLSMSLRTVAY